MTRGILPDENALYIFYTEGEPILTGSVPHVDELALLAPSFRASHKVHIRNYRSHEPAPPAFTRPRALAAHARRWPAPIQARWLAVEDTTTRMMLEIFAAQTLGLNLCHPQIRNALLETPASPPGPNRIV